MKISKEGFKIIAVSGVVLLALWLLIFYMLKANDLTWLIILLSVLLLVFWFFIISFFRDPRRVRIHDDDLVFSPCDGRVVVTEIVKDDEYFDGDELKIELHKAIASLPEKQRLVFNMRYFQEMKYEQISEILGTSVGALKASYHHAVKKIEDHFSES